MGNITLKELLRDDYGDYNISIRNTGVGENCIIIYLEKDGLNKFLVYDCENKRPVTNLLDSSFDFYITREEVAVRTGNTNFAQDFYDKDDIRGYGIAYSHTVCNDGDKLNFYSFEINGKIRAFICLSNNRFGLAYPVGYDLNRQEYVKFPINEFGLIDDAKMKEIVLQNNTKGFDKDEYIRASYEIYLNQRISDLLKDDYNYTDDTTEMIMAKLAEYNYDKTREINRKIESEGKSK